MTAVDTHIVMVPNPGGAVPTPLPHPFSGKLEKELSGDVEIEGKAAATVGSIAVNDPKHTPTQPGTSFQSPPSNEGTVDRGSSSVTINGKAAARSNDAVKTCNDPTNLPVGTIIATSTVEIGG